jgi:putative transposase
VLTQVGSVDIEVPRDRDASFNPQIVRKRRRRLDGIDGIVLSLSAKGLTTGEVSAHLAEVYGATVSKETISKITDRVLDSMAEWQSRPLDPVYPVIFVDAITYLAGGGDERRVRRGVGVLVDPGGSPNCPLCLLRTISTSPSGRRNRRRQLGLGYGYQ